MKTTLAMAVSLVLAFGMAGCGVEEGGAADAVNGRESAASAPTWPTPTSTVTLTATQNVTGTFDGGMKRYVGAGDLGTDGSSESQLAMFVLANGATLQNVILGSPAADGVHCKGTCTLKNVWWEDVGEDAATMEGSSTGAMTIDGGGARAASDKIFQHNGSGLMTIRNFYAENFGKLYRSCGNCKSNYQGQRHSVIQNIVATRCNSSIAGINSNYGDTADISGLTILGDTSHSTTICVRYQGNNTGAEPTKLGSGPGSGCNYDPAAISWSATTTNFALSVTRSGTGSGTVTSNTGGINCGSTCSASYASGTTVTLSAAAASGSTFAGWSGSCSGTGSTCSVSMTAARAVTATFNASSGTAFALTVTKAGTGSGTVTSNTGGISCGSTCSASYASGTTVTLSAAAASGSTFAGWSGSCSGTGSTCSVSMTAARSVTAAFNTSGGTGTAPCANAIAFTGNTGNFNSTGAVCYRTGQVVNGWGCSNFSGRTVSVNGGAVTASCGAGPFPLAQVGGYTYFSATAGEFPWASIYVW